MHAHRPSHAALEQTLSRLLTENGAALRRLAASYAASGDRDDLLQEIAMAVWRALPKFRGECSERTFLFRIAHNRCITHLSRRRPTVSLDEVEVEPQAPGAGTEAELSEEQERERLLRAVRRLPMIYREVTVLVLEGLDYSTIADIMGISESNVGVRLNRARQQLKTLIEEKS
jgi:RNA polymerase sigma-70 factor (ECF subfamily)